VPAARLPRAAVSKQVVQAEVTASRARLSSQSARVAQCSQMLQSWSRAALLEPKAAVPAAQRQAFQ